MRASSVTKAPFQTLWHLHPGVRSGDQLSLGERAADRMQHDGFLAVCLLILRGHDLVGGPKHADLAACPQPSGVRPLSVHSVEPLLVDAGRRSGGSVADRGETS